jgi:predicted RNase H-like nuclease (RuvC/YqgF family)
MPATTDSRLTNDPRYVERLELQLRQADERAQNNDNTINRLSEQVSTLQARVADLKPLAEAAQEHRQKASTEAKRADQAERLLQKAQARIAGLEQELADGERRVASLEDDLAGYEKLAQKVKEAGDLFDLLDS